MSVNACLSNRYSPDRKATNNSKLSTTNQDIGLVLNKYNGTFQNNNGTKATSGNKYTP